RDRAITDAAPTRGAGAPAQGLQQPPDRHRLANKRRNREAACQRDSGRLRCGQSCSTGAEPLGHEHPAPMRPSSMNSLRWSLAGMSAIDQRVA
ncbi:hypothetical protein, partial [Acinetobacter baumannii]|uniref:hypothetical protein n=1 Tax=Acinetobacter baumannii TaxID=470 RepID=UPI001D1706CB